MIRSILAPGNPRFLRAVILAATLLGSAGGASAQNSTYPVQEFRIGIGGTDRNVVGTATAAGSPLASATNAGTRLEKWSLTFVSTGVYEIVNSQSGHVVTHVDGRAVTSPDVDGANQRWRIVPVAKDFEGFDLLYKIVGDANTSLGLSLDTATNALAVASYAGGEFQKFKLNLDGLEGFAANSRVGGKEKAGTIGGLLGATEFVSTRAQLVAALNKVEPLTVVVTADLDLVDQPKDQQRIRDKKTLVGSYARNTLYDCQLRNDDFNGADPAPSNNIVVRNMNFVARTLNSTGSGVILLSVYGGRNIWIDHNDFSATFAQNRDVEVGKFLWINTPAANWSDGVYNGVNPDYITISYNSFVNRYWTVAFGSQNKDVSRLRSTMMFNRWEQCSRRTPQYSNGYLHLYSSFHTVTGPSNPNASSQVIAGEGSRVLSENMRFEALAGKEIDIDRSTALAYQDLNSYAASSTSATPSRLSVTPQGTAWKASDSYGYSLVAGYDASGKDAKAFANAFSGCFKSYAEIKYVTDADLASWVSWKGTAPFLKSVAVGSLVRIEPIQGTLIRDLLVQDTANFMDWKISTGTNLGSLAYGDRDVTYTILPPFLLGSEAILTAADSKNRTADLATFVAAKDLSVTVALDRRVATTPAWLSSWTRLSDTAMASNDVVYVLFRKDAKSGSTVLLGQNGQAAGCLTYTVFATLAGASVSVGSRASGPRMAARLDATRLSVDNPHGSAARVVLLRLDGKSVGEISVPARGSASMDFATPLAPGAYALRWIGASGTSSERRFVD